MPSTRLRAMGIVPLLALILLLASPGAPLAQPAQPARPEALRIPQEGGEVSVIADQLQQVGGATNLLVATGNVEIVRGGTRLLADRVELNRDTGEAIAQGKVVFFDGQDRLVGDRIDYNLRTGHRCRLQRLRLLGAVLPHRRRPDGPGGRGDLRDQGRHLHHLRGRLAPLVVPESGKAPPISTTSSTGGMHRSGWARCPCSPGFPSSPRLIRRERQSGFLFPQAGVSSRKGYFAKIPYFWAIDDSQDLTASLDVYTNRGHRRDGGLPLHPVPGRRRAPSPAS